MLDIFMSDKNYWSNRILYDKLAKTFPDLTKILPTDSAIEHKLTESVTVKSIVALNFGIYHDDKVYGMPSKSDIHLEISSSEVPDEKHILIINHEQTLAKPLFRYATGKGMNITKPNKVHLFLFLARAGTHIDTRDIPFGM